MSRRERIILGITIAVAVVGALFFVHDKFAKSDEGSEGGVANAQRTFEDSFRKLQDGPAIRQAYEVVNTQLPERLPNRTPEATFSDEVTRLLKERGWPTPTVKPARPSPIPDVDDYYYIDLEVSVAGRLAEIINLMIEFKNTGLLIKAFDVDKRSMDRDEVMLNVTVARLAKMDEEKRKKLSSQRRGG